MSHSELNFSNVRSSNARRSVMEDYDLNADKVVLAYAGNNANVSKVQARNIDYAQHGILFVGLDWQRKGGPDLVKSFQLVREKCPEARLTIIGPRPEIHIPDCVVMGSVKPEGLDLYYQRTSMFCLPTHLEPFGIVFTEAMTAHR